MNEKDGKFDQLKGNLKETAGNATGDKQVEEEGKRDKRAGKAKEFVDDAGRKVNEAVDNVFKDKDKK